jgi:hypothetical protein
MLALGGVNDVTGERKALLIIFSQLSKQGRSQTVEVDGAVWCHSQVLLVSLAAGRCALAAHPSPIN